MLLYSSHPLLVVICSILCICLSFRGARAQSTKLGDWRDLSKELGWRVFNRKGQPFDPRGNLAICQRHVIDIPLTPGVGDYSGRINAALKELRVRNPPGGTVKLGAGMYPLKYQISMPSYTCLAGAGMRATTLRVIDNSPKFRLSGVVRSFQTERVTILDMTIDGNKDRQLSFDPKLGGYGRYGVFTELTNWFYVNNVNVINHLGYGFDPHGSKLEWAYFLLIENSRAENNGLDGFTLDQSVYVGLRNSVGVNNYRHGTNIVTGTRYCRLTNNVMRDNGFKVARGVGCNIMAQNNHFKGTMHLSFIGNLLSNPSRSGFCFKQVHHIGVERNRIEVSQPRAYCYHVDAITNLKLRGNACKTTAKSRIIRKLNLPKLQFLPPAKMGRTAVSTRPRST